MYWQGYINFPACDKMKEELIFRLVIFSQQCFFHLYADSGFQALFLQRAAFIVGLCETAAVTDIIGVAAAAAIITSPAAHTSFFAQDVALLELAA